MKDRLNILFVCGRNKRRSKTAEQIFRKDNRLNVRSAGLSPKSTHQISEEDLEWADLVFAMEFPQKRRITKTFRAKEIPNIKVLHIEDIYDYMDEELIVLLTEGVNDYIENL